MSAGHIYVIDLGVDGVKVGSSMHRFNRLAPYAGHADELHCWSSPRHEGYRGTERDLINACKRRGWVSKGHEWLEGADFFEVVEIARSLTQGHLPQEGLRAA